MVHGPIDAGAVVCHHCDNRACVRADHLFIGTQLDNIRDMDRKGRSRRPVLPGEKNGRAKLTSDDVASIRRAHSDGETYRALAARYGVTYGMIGHICRGVCWRERAQLAAKRISRPAQVPMFGGAL